MSANCAFTLVASAPFGGETLQITTGSTKLSAPASTTVAAGGTSGSFNVTALTGYVGPVSITLSANGNKYSATISSAEVGRKPINGDGSKQVTSVPHSLSCSPKLAQAGSTVNCSLQPTEAASDGGAEFTLSASSASVRLPGTVKARAHQSKVSFQAVVDSHASSEPVSVQAAFGETTAQETISLQASSKPVLRVPGKQFVKLGSGSSFDVTAYGDGSPAMLSARSLPPGAQFDSNTGHFSWTPGPSQKGEWKVAFSASDSIQRSSDADVFIYAGSGEPTIDAVRNAASGSTDSVCSGGSLATAEGGWLASGTASDASGQSLTLAGTSVLVNGSNVPMVSVSPTQVSFVCPASVDGTELSVSVATSAGRSAPLKVVARTAVPGVFTIDGSTSMQAAAIVSNTSQVAMARNYRLLSQPRKPGIRCLSR